METLQQKSNQCSLNALLN